MQIERRLHHFKIMTISSNFLCNLHDVNNLLNGVDIASLCQLILPRKTAITAYTIGFEKSFTYSILVEFEGTR
jgi:hypothetical protein